MNTKNIHQTVSIKAPVNVVYKALMNSREHSRITGAKAVIGTKPGSPFSVWEGGIRGITLSVIPEKKIVQAWRDEGWPKDHYSVASFSFEKTGRGTKLVFDQYGVPLHVYRQISDGWKIYYWNPMRMMLEK